MLRRNFLRRAVGKPPQQETVLPWLIDAESLTDKCTQCAKCLDACPEDIIVKGSGGFPTVDFKQGECTFCAKCADVCPEALFDTTQAQPWLLAPAISDECFPKHSIVCQSCRDACEYSAIKFDFLSHSIPAPQVDTDKCSGCGACVSTCPKNAISLAPTHRDITDE